MASAPVPVSWTSSPPAVSVSLSPPLPIGSWLGCLSSPGTSQNPPMPPPPPLPPLPFSLPARSSPRFSEGSRGICAPVILLDLLPMLLDPLPPASSSPWSFLPLSRPSIPFPRSSRLSASHFSLSSAFSVSVSRSSLSKTALSCVTSPTDTSSSCASADCLCVTASASVSCARVRNWAGTSIERTYVQCSPRT